MNDVSQLFLMLLAFEFKQFLCDYPIHPTFILKSFQTDNNRAFLFHAGIHALLTLAICLIFTTAEFPLALMLAGLDFFMDFALAIFRSRTGFIARFKPLDLDEFMEASRHQKVQHRLYWLFYGLDRMIHHVTYFAIIYILCQQGVVWMM